MQPIFLAIRRRLGLLALAASVGIVVSIESAGDGAPRDVDELAESLGRSASVTVLPEDIRWEPSRGAVVDFVVGRYALFLGAAGAGMHDVYRARVRLSPEGRPLDIATVKNLTSTPLGDDHSLVVRGTHAAFATWAFGQEQSVTFLDLAGEGARNTTTKLLDRTMAWVTNVQLTGDGDGIGRIDITLDQPANRVGLAMNEDALDIALADDAAARAPTRKTRLDFVTGDLTAPPPAGIHAEASRHLPKKLSHWAVDTVRAVSWIGPEPIAWLEDKTFAMRDTVRQALFKVSGGGEALANVEAAPPASILDASQAAADLGHWPPTAIKSIWKTPEAGEGEWETPKQPWIKKAANDAPSPFYRTFVRPDEDRPYAKVLLVAMDMRQLDLDMEAGSEDPKPLAGPPGSGRIPRDPAVYTRVAAAFNGGFKTEHGAYGMMVHKRVLLPPMPGVATVIVTKDAHVGLGTWGQNKDVGGINDVDPASINSYRQNLDPLVDSDKLNPSGRAQWGFTLPGTGVQTERSGICVTNAGHLVYAWGDDVSAVTLAKAMKMSGCIYGMHLDMNPYHTGFIFTNIETLKEKSYKSELLTTKMEIAPERYIAYAPKDFFYVTIHDPAPPALDTAKWEPDPGVQPAPAWMAGVWRSVVGDVDLLDVEPGRASFRVRAGTNEPSGHEAGARELDDDDAHRVLFALTLGTAENKRHRGLVTNGRLAMPMSGAEETALLVASEDGQLTIAAANAPLARTGDAVELPLLIDEGKILTHTHAVAAALGTTPQGRVYVARGRSGATSESVARILMHAGCTHAVLLDRGAGTRGSIFRAGTDTPPRSRYEDTTISVMGKALAPRGFRFEATHPVEPPTPLKKK